ncbi:hypothetical protein HDU67_009611 [Dinochytrium kinnereticum]|nr:hypothetical protein HDU67_009611 [Dinochytrium kinnereticum]
MDPTRPQQVPIDGNASAADAGGGVEGKYAKRLSYLTELERNAHDLTARVQKMRSVHESMVTGKASNYVFSDDPPSPSSAHGDEPTSGRRTSRRPSSSAGSYASVTTLVESPTIGGVGFFSGREEEGKSKRISVGSTGKRASMDFAVEDGRRSSGLFETSISMDRQGSSGLASLVSSLAETAERKAAKKSAPPPMPDKSWPKVRELVKSLEKKKAPDAPESPTSPSPPRQKPANALRSFLTRPTDKTRPISLPPPPAQSSSSQSKLSGRPISLPPPPSMTVSSSSSLSQSSCNIPLPPSTIKSSTSSSYTIPPLAHTPFLTSLLEGPTPSGSGRALSVGSIGVGVVMGRTGSVAEISRRLEEKSKTAQSPPVSPMRSSEGSKSGSLGTPSASPPRSVSERKEGLVRVSDTPLTPVTSPPRVVDEVVCDGEEKKQGAVRASEAVLTQIVSRRVADKDGDDKENDTKALPLIPSSEMPMSPRLSRSRSMAQIGRGGLMVVTNASSRAASPPGSDLIASAGGQEKRELTKRYSTPELGGASLSHFFTPPSFLRARRRFSGSTTPTSPSGVMSPLEAVIETSSLAQNDDTPPAPSPPPDNIEPPHLSESTVTATTLTPPAHDRLSAHMEPPRRHKVVLEQYEIAMTALEDVVADGEDAVSSPVSVREDDDATLSRVSSLSSFEALSDSEPLVTLAELEAMRDEGSVPVGSADGVLRDWMEGDLEDGRVGVKDGALERVGEFAALTVQREALVSHAAQAENGTPLLGLASVSRVDEHREPAELKSVETIAEELDAVDAWEASKLESMAAITDGLTVVDEMLKQESRVAAVEELPAVDAREPSEPEATAVISYEFPAVDGALGSRSDDDNAAKLAPAESMTVSPVLGSGSLAREEVHPEPSKQESTAAIAEESAVIDAREASKLESMAAITDGLTVVDEMLKEETRIATVEELPAVDAREASEPEATAVISYELPAVDVALGSRSDDDNAAKLAPAESKTVSHVLGSGSLAREEERPEPSKQEPTATIAEESAVIDAEEPSKLESIAAITDGLTVVDEIDEINEQESIATVEELPAVDAREASEPEATAVISYELPAVDVALGSRSDDDNAAKLAPAESMTVSPVLGSGSLAREEEHPEPSKQESTAAIAEESAVIDEEEPSKLESMAAVAVEVSAVDNYEVILPSSEPEAIAATPAELAALDAPEPSEPRPIAAIATELAIATAEESSKLGNADAVAEALVAVDARGPFESEPKAAFAEELAAVDAGEPSKLESMAGTFEDLTAGDARDRYVPDSTVAIAKELAVADAGEPSKLESMAVSVEELPAVDAPEPSEPEAVATIAPELHAIEASLGSGSDDDKEAILAPAAESETCSLSLGSVSPSRQEESRGLSEQESTVAVAKEIAVVDAVEPSKQELVDHVTPSDPDSMASIAKELAVVGAEESSQQEALGSVAEVLATVDASEPSDLESITAFAEELATVDAGESSIQGSIAASVEDLSVVDARQPSAPESIDAIAEESAVADTGKLSKLGTQDAIAEALAEIDTRKPSEPESMTAFAEELAAVDAGEPFKLKSVATTVKDLTVFDAPEPEPIAAIIDELAVVGELYKHEPRAATVEDLAVVDAREACVPDSVVTIAEEPSKLESIDSVAKEFVPEPSEPESLAGSLTELATFDAREPCLPDSTAATAEELPVAESKLESIVAIVEKLPAVDTKEPSESESMAIVADGVPAIDAPLCNGSEDDNEAALALAAESETRSPLLVSISLSRQEESRGTSEQESTVAVAEEIAVVDAELLSKPESVDAITKNLIAVDAGELSKPESKAVIAEGVHAVDSPVGSKYADDSEAFVAPVPQPEAVSSLQVSVSPFEGEDRELVEQESTADISDDLAVAADEPSKQESMGAIVEELPAVDAQEPSEPKSMAVIAEEIPAIDAPLGSGSSDDSEASVARVSEPETFSSLQVSVSPMEGEHRELAEPESAAAICEELAVGEPSKQESIDAIVEQLPAVDICEPREPSELESMADIAEEIPAIDVPLGSGSSDDSDASVAPVSELETVSSLRVSVSLMEGEHRELAELGSIAAISDELAVADEPTKQESMDAIVVELPAVDAQEPSESESMVVIGEEIPVIDAPLGSESDDGNEASLAPAAESEICPPSVRSASPSKPQESQGLSKQETTVSTAEVLTVIDCKEPSKQESVNAIAEEFAAAREQAIPESIAAIAKDLVAADAEKLFLEEPLASNAEKLTVVDAEPSEPTSLAPVTDEMSANLGLDSRSDEDQKALIAYAGEDEKLSLLSFSLSRAKEQLDASEQESLAAMVEEVVVVDCLGTEAEENNEEDVSVEVMHQEVAITKKDRVLLSDDLNTTAPAAESSPACSDSEETALITLDDLIAFDTDSNETGVISISRIDSYGVQEFVSVPLSISFLPTPSPAAEVEISLGLTRCDYVTGFAEREVLGGIRISEFQEDIASTIYIPPGHKSSLVVIPELSVLDQPRRLEEEVETAESSPISPNKSLEGGKSGTLVTVDTSKPVIDDELKEEPIGLPPCDYVDGVTEKEVMDVVRISKVQDHFAPPIDVLTKRKASLVAIPESTESDLVGEKCVTSSPLKPIRKPEPWLLKSTAAFRNLCMAVFVLHCAATAGKSAVDATQRAFLGAMALVDPLLLGHIFVVAIVGVWVADFFGRRGVSSTR